MKTYSLELKENQMDTVIDLLNQSIKEYQKTIMKEGFDTNQGITFSNLAFTEGIRSVFTLMRLNQHRPELNQWKELL